MNHQEKNESSEVQKQSTKNYIFDVKIVQVHEYNNYQSVLFC